MHVEYKLDIATSDFTDRALHHNHEAIGSKFKDRLTILSAEQSKLLRCETEVGWKAQLRQDMEGSVLLRCVWAGRNGHRSNPWERLRVGRIQDHSSA
jgi:hypothetical protein